MPGHVLVIGGSGQLGRRVVQRALQDGWRVTATYRSVAPSILEADWQFLDLVDLHAVEPLVQAVAPDAIVHAAALAQSSDRHFWRINADGSAAIAASCRVAGARLVHLSSDALFAGRSAPYTEDDDPCPLSPYGASKAAAETAVRAIAPDAAIVRTSLIIDDDPIDKHSRMVLDIAADRRAEALFTDEIRCPVAAVDLAAAVVELLTNGYGGVLNVVGADAISRYELGVLVARRYGSDPSQLRIATVQGSGLQRPTMVQLDIARARQVLTTTLRGANDFLRSDEAHRPSVSALPGT